MKMISFILRLWHKSWAKFYKNKAYGSDNQFMVNSGDYYTLQAFCKMNYHNARVDSLPPLKDGE